MMVVRVATGCAIIVRHVVVTAGGFAVAFCNAIVSYGWAPATYIRLQRHVAPCCVLRLHASVGAGSRRSHVHVFVAMATGVL